MFQGVDVGVDFVEKAKGGCNMQKDEAWEGEGGWRPSGFGGPDQQYAPEQTRKAVGTVMLGSRA